VSGVIVTTHNKKYLNALQVVQTVIQKKL